MRIAALILGILGGLGAILLGVGGLEAAKQLEAMGMTGYATLFTVLFWAPAALGLLGAALVLPKPRLGSTLMALAAIVIVAGIAYLASYIGWQLASNSIHPIIWATMVLLAVAALLGFMNKSGNARGVSPTMS